MNVLENARTTPQEKKRDPYLLVAMNGARRTHADHPAVPLSPDEIVASAGACHAAGAQGVHLHVRDDEGRHSLDAGRYREVIEELRRTVPTMDIQITTESAGLYDVPEQLHCLTQVQPEWASISVREVARAPDLADRIYGACAEQDTRVQHIVYDKKDAALLDLWQARGTVRPEQVDRLFVLGRYTAGQKSCPDDLKPFLPTGAPWMVCAFGPDEHTCLIEAARRGGDLRVGFENSLTDSENTPWADNAASVAALVQALERSRI